MNEEIRKFQAVLWAWCIQACDDTQDESRPVVQGPSSGFCPVC